jgi:hypothetical protein
MCLPREGHNRRRAGGDAAQRSRRLAGLLPRVRRPSVRDSSQTDGQLSHQAEAASGVAGAAFRCRRRGLRPVGRPAIAQPAGPPVLVRRQFGTCSLGATGRASAPRGLRQGKANVRKDTERSVAAERSRHSRRSLQTLLHCRHLGSVAETAAFSRIQKPVPLLPTSLGVTTRASRHRPARPQRLDTRASGGALSGRVPAARPARRAPTRVLTKVNFENRPDADEGNEGFRGSGRDW